MAACLIIIATFQQSPGPDWERVPVNEFLTDYEPASQELQQFYGNCSFECFYPADEISFFVKTLDGQSFSKRQRVGYGDRITVIRPDGRFKIRADAETGKWTPDLASPNSPRNPWGGVGGDQGFGAFLDRNTGMTFVDLLTSRPERVGVFRNGTRYRICYGQLHTNEDGSEQTDQRHYELDSTKGWVCVEVGLTKADTGLTEPGFYGYKESGPGEVPIMESWKVPVYPEGDLVIRNFDPTPPDPAVFKLTTYGLPESLLAPKVTALRPKWGWLQSPITLAVGGALFLLLAYRLRRA